jgi:hypothetical protein
MGTATASLGSAMTGLNRASDVQMSQKMTKKTGKNFKNCKRRKT